MATSKRERQKAGRQARIEEAQRLQRRADMRRRTFTIVGVMVAVLLLAFLLSLRGGDDESDNASTTVAAGTGPPPPGPGASITGETPCPATDGTAERTTSFENPPPDCLEQGVAYAAVFDTSEGEIRVDLAQGLAPGAVNNFITLARYGYYEDTSIFRTDPNLEIIQGGAPTTGDNADPGPGYTIPDEGDAFTYAPGQLVMARTSQPDSSGGQYFFVAGPGASSLDAQGNYIVLGETDAAGIEVVQAILDLNENPDGDQLGGSPSRPVVINSVTIEEA